MPFLENLIRQRVFALISSIYEIFEGRFLLLPDKDLDIELTIVEQTLSLSFKLDIGGTILIEEEYAVSKYELQVKYFYAYKNQKGKTIISFDNAPHHKQLSSFPHHKHHYPKSRYEAMWFS